MLLSGKEIERKLGSDLVIEPYNPKQLNPNSYESPGYDKDAADSRRWPPAGAKSALSGQDG